MTAPAPSLEDARYKTQEQERKLAEGPSAPVKLWERLSARPWIAHWIRTFERFSDRLGDQFAAAITYFSFLSLVPVLMLGFSIAGFVLAGQPTLLNELKTSIGSTLSAAGGDTGKNLTELIDKAVQARLSVGIVALVVGLYTGLGWMGNIRQAIQAQWRPQWEQDPQAKDSFLVGKGKDLLGLAVLGLASIISVVLTTIGSTLTDTIARWVGLADAGWFTTLLRVVPIMLALGVSTLLFYFAYRWLPDDDRIPRKYVLRGAIGAAVLFELLKLLVSLLVKQFSSSPTAAVFGSVIALLAFLNLVVRMVLIVAAWIATAVPDPEPKSADEVAVVIQPQYKVVAVEPLLGGLGVGVAAGWLARTLKRG